MLTFNSTPPLYIREGTRKGYIEVMPGECFDYTFHNSKLRRGRLMNVKSNALQAGHQDFLYYYIMNDKEKLHRLQSRMPTDKQGVEIEIDGKVYMAFIRRLTPTECARLQTIPESYEFVTSESQVYKGLGNCWTVEVIKHIYSFLPKELLYGKK